MIIRPENTSRKIDGLGRITIPKSLRDRMGIDVNDDMELFVIEASGRTYIAISPVDAINERYRVAAQTLLELDIAVPAELAVKAGLDLDLVTSHE